MPKITWIVKLFLKYDHNFVKKKKTYNLLYFGSVSFIFIQFFIFEKKKSNLSFNIYSYNSSMYYKCTHKTT